MQAALAFLSMIDEEAFEAAMSAVTPASADDSEDEDPIPLCATCGAPIGIFPEVTLNCKAGKLRFVAGCQGGRRGWRWRWWPCGWCARPCPWRCIWTWRA